MPTLNGVKFSETPTDSELMVLQRFNIFFVRT